MKRRGTRRRAAGVNKELGALRGRVSVLGMRGEGGRHGRAVTVGPLPEGSQHGAAPGDAAGDAGRSA